jgi:hypothetical protein
MSRKDEIREKVAGHVASFQVGDYISFFTIDSVPMEGTIEKIDGEKAVVNVVGRFSLTADLVIAKKVKND